MENHKIIRIPEVVAHCKCAFHELIECVHVHIHEELTRQITDGEADTRFPFGMKTPNGLTQKPEYISIFDVLPKNAHQDLVVNAGKEFSDITLQDPHSPRVIVGNSPAKFPEPVDGAVYALTLPTGK